MTAASNHLSGLKLIIVGRRKPGTTLAEHRHHIRHVHGEMVLRYIATDPVNAPQRYVQHQVFDGQFRATPPGNDPFALNRDFITQIWAQDFAALGQGTATAFYRDHLKGDEDNFVDQTTVVFMPTKPREIRPRNIDPGSAASATPVMKLFGFIQKAPDVDAQQFVQTWSSISSAMMNSQVASSVLGHVQNDVLPKPGPAATVDGIDEFWLRDEASARAIFTLWRSWIEEHLVRPGLAVGSGSFGLFAYEDVVYAGR